MTSPRSRSSMMNRVKSRLLSLMFVLTACVLGVMKYDLVRLPVAVAIPPALGCPIGQFCGRTIDQTGGCTTAPCCPQNQTMCNSNKSQVTSPFPRVTGANPGTCMKLQNPITICHTWPCQGAVLCSEGTCGIGDEEEPDSARPWVSTGQACPTGVQN